MTITNPRRLLLFLFVVIGIPVLLAYWLVVANVSIQKNGTFVIEEGTAAVTVWAGLVDQGYTSRTLPWRYHASRLAIAGDIKAGSYQLERGERARSVIQRFVAGDVSPDELTITYPEGFTLEQMAERTAGKGIGSKQEFLDAASDPKEYLLLSDVLFLGDIPAGRDLEGYLFPDTYRVFEDDEAADVIKRMLVTFSERFGDQLKTEAAASGRSLDQIVIMASIIEREVLTDDDMALVSGVLWKRFDEGIGLDADATVRYALNKWDDPLTVQDLASESPYNTRKWRGLPPGPISNPGLRALIAAVRPEKSAFYYYLSAPSGETIFARTNDEHNVNKAKYLR